MGEIFWVERTEGLAGLIGEIVLIEEVLKAENLFQVVKEFAQETLSRSIPDI